MTKAVAEKLTANTRHATTGEYAEQPNDGQQMANVQPSQPVITNVHETVVIRDDTPPLSPQTPIIIIADDDIPSHPRAPPGDELDEHMGASENPKTLTPRGKEALCLRGAMTMERQHLYERGWGEGGPGSWCCDYQLVKDDHRVDVSPTMTCPKQFTQANLS
jgi:hypothetical protein